MSKPTDFIQRLLRWRLFLIVNLVILFFLSLGFGREWLRNASIESQISELQSEKEALEARNVELLSLGQTIQTQFYLEQEGRRKYGLRKPGEELVIVTETQTPQPAQTETTSGASIDSGQDDADVAKISNPRRWWYYLFDAQAYQNLQERYDQ